MKAIAILCLLFATSSYAQCQKGPDSKPTIDIVMPQQLDSSTTTNSLQRLDFRNHHFNIFDEHGKVVLSAKLRNGKYESKWKPQKGSDWLRIDWIRPVGDNPEFAVVSLSWVTTGASASDFGVVQVFGLRDGHPLVIQQIMFNTRGCGTSAKLSNPPVKLVVKGVHGWEHCCPKTLDVVIFSWIDGTFHRESSRSVPLPESC